MEEIYSFYNKYALSLLNGDGEFMSDDESSDLLQKSSRTSEGQGFRLSGNFGDDENKKISNRNLP